MCDHLRSRTSGLVRALAVLGLSFAYFSTVFQIFRGEFWTSGMGDWMDPYFVNSLLEHWTLSITRLERSLIAADVLSGNRRRSATHMASFNMRRSTCRSARSSIRFRPIT